MRNSLVYLLLFILMQIIDLITGGQLDSKFNIKSIHPEKIVENTPTVAC